MTPRSVAIARPRRVVPIARGARSAARSRAPLALRGKVALVTGAGRGLGRAIALALGEAGGTVVLAARTEREIVDTTRILVRRGTPALAFVCDVRDATEVSGLVEATMRSYWRLDIVVNNAGVFRIAPVAQTDEELWNEVIDTNLKGTYLVTRAALPHLRRSHGHFVNIVSIAARTAFPGNAAYCASKWGALGFTNVLREEVRDAGVRVTAVLAGAIDTTVWDAAPGRWNRRRMQAPETIAQAIVAACSQPEGTTTDEIVLTPTSGAQ